MLYDARYKATQSRTSSRDKVLKHPPRFRFVAEYHAAIYDPRRRAVYEGSWNDLHFWIAINQGVAEPSDNWSNIKRYVSADVFTLRAARGTRAMIVDEVWDLKGTDIITIQNYGYCPMSPYYNWILTDGANLIEVPS